MERLHSLAGFVALIVIAWLMSSHKKRFPWRTVIAGVVLQFAIAAVLILAPQGRIVFRWINAVVVALQEATEKGTAMVFGYVGGGPPPFEVSSPGNMVVFGLQKLPLVLVVGALSSLLFYWKVLPVVIRGMSWGLRKTMGISGCEGLATASNIFIGMVESPLLIRPYMATLSRSQLFTVMVGGMATIAGTVLALYASFLTPTMGEGIAGHLLLASLISAPAALLLAKVMVPETGAVEDVEPEIKSDATSSMDAIVKGTLFGVELLINIVAMIVVFVALVALVNIILKAFGDVGGAPLTLERMLGWVMAPVVWLIGIPWSEARTAGSLMGTKTILNELLAYLSLSRLPQEALSPRSRLIVSYALCGFANFGSLGIMIGGLGAMAPQRRGEIIQLGLRSIVAGTLATLMTGAVIGTIGRW